jgi:FkbM family methyltransferase
MSRVASGPAPLAPATPYESVDPTGWQALVGYNAEDRALFDLFPPAGSAPRPGFVTNFLGVVTRVGFVTAFRAHDGRVYGTPLPTSDGHFAETVEYIGLLKSVATARGRFTALEFGAGWGPWLVNGAAAARSRGIEDIRLNGVEPDPGHFASMRAHFLDNGLDPDAHRLDNAAIGVEGGTARWPKLSCSADDFGVRPMDGGTDYLGREFQEHLEVGVLAFRDVLAREEVWDLVHIDVQGTETELCTAEADLLDRRVRWLVIGTHSRKIEGDLVELFFRRGWVLENEKTALIRYAAQAPSLEAMTFNDGTQIWRNPRF